MRYDYQIRNANLRITKGEMGYQEVLDDFDNAKKIRIITYNITSNPNDVLFNKLLGLKNVDIQFITNIPSRFEWYSTSDKGEYLRKTARSNIDKYLSKLNPKDFDNLIPFFNFNNHAKIIGTENIIYIGSQNFSNASENNYEAGIITRDKKFIEELYDSFFEELKANSEPYFKQGYNETRLFISSIYTRLLNHYNYICENLFTEYKKRLVFINDETSINTDDLHKLSYDLDEIRYIKNNVENIDSEDIYMEELYEELTKIIEQINADELIELISEESDIYNYIDYGFEKEYDKQFEKYSIEAYDEHLDYYVDLASDDARDVLADLLCSVEDDIYIMKDKLNDIILILEQALHILEEYYGNSINEDVDNTK